MKRVSAPERTSRHEPWFGFGFFGIPSLAALVVGLLGVGVAAAERALGSSMSAALRRASLAVALALAWAGLTLLLAQSGVLARFDARPPPLVPLLGTTLLAAFALARSRFGGRLQAGLPLWALVGVQAFRLPLELVLHRAALDGTMPVEMSFAGYNFDILSGGSALLMAPALALGWVGRRAALAWNIFGLLLLGNIVGIAVAATPVFHAFGPEHLNVWIAHPPYVLLPTILVLAALLGHLLIFRKLAELRKTRD